MAGIWKCALYRHRFLLVSKFISTKSFARRCCQLLSIIAWLALVGCTSESNVDSQPASIDFRDANVQLNANPELDETDAKIFNVNLTEELLLTLTPQLHDIEKFLCGQSSLPKNHFSNSFAYAGLLEFHLEQKLLDSNLHEPIHLSWPADNADAQPTSPNKIWDELRKQVVINDAQFGILSAKLYPDDETFEMDVKFEGRGTANARIVGIKAKQKVRWQRDSGIWQIINWKQQKLELLITSEPLFENVTRQAIPDQTTFDLATSSHHESLLIERAKNPDLLKNYNPVFQYFADWNSLFNYTSASVIDIDNDGWDDVFLLDRVGDTLMLRNCQDGSFEDVTTQYGLKIKQVMANCALFADFDNDGDPDLLLGRALQPSLFLRNEGGKFVQDEETNRELFQVRFVSSASVIDVNNDGLLDVYLSTYATRAGYDMGWIQFAVPPQQQAELHARVRNSHSFIDRRGPPNVLLLNKDGNLKRGRTPEPLDQWRNSFQPLWIDYDEDGDSDLYLCNDFAPDALLRNNTPRGTYQIEFEDVTQEAIPSGAMGFSMGASPGDYNSDGLIDLYISNMYSKAGQRIIDYMDGEVHPRIEVSSQGNFLYQNCGGEFRQVAGLSPSRQQVAKVGWSFGGQFADFNNDTKLDVYVPSGFFSPPEDISDSDDL